MWQSVYISQNSEDVEKIQSLLQTQNILTKIKTNNDTHLELFVPATELSLAQELILSQ